MAGGSWKVAYADFVTAMMAFFLLMWILNMAPEETKVYLEGYFTSGGEGPPAGSGMSTSATPFYLNPAQQIDVHKLSENEAAQLNLVKELQTALNANTEISSSSGISSDDVGVLLHVNADAMFDANSANLNPEGRQVLDSVINVMHKFKVFCIVRGHTDPEETGAPNFASKWELGGARAAACIAYLTEKGVDPGLLRAVSYADTRPLVPSTTPGAAAMNRRVEFYFHRQEAMSNIVGY